MALGHLVAADATRAAELLDRDLGVPGERGDLAVGLALHELADEGALAVTGGPQGQSERGRRLALALAGVDLDVAALGRRTSRAL